MTDLTGRSQIARNVVVSWGSHLFIILAGFIVPRQISDNLGPEILGLWDLGWVTVRYMALTNLDVSSALNRYVALYRAREDHHALSRAATTVAIWQTLLAAGLVVLTLVLSWAIIHWVDIPDQLAREEVRWMMLFLGLSLAVQMLGAPAGAIITGCHRWDLQHSINACQDFLLALMMVAILWFGGGLATLALLVLAAAAVTAVSRLYFARRLCPQIRFRPRYWDKPTAIKMLRFGGKSIIAGSPQILIFQTVGLALAGYAGPEMLAIVNRGAALIRVCEQLVRKVATMFVPMTSGLIGLERNAEAKALLLNASRYTLCAIMPMALFLICYGDQILRLWMGEGYADATMLILLVTGAILPIAQTGAMSVLTGFNLHGRIAIANLGVAALSLVLLVPWVTAIGWTPARAAAVIGGAWTLSGSVLLPFYIRRHFDIGIGRYLYNTLLMPLACNIPLAILLYLGRQAALTQSWWLMTGCWLAGGALTLALYWRAILPPHTRAELRNKWQASVHSWSAANADKPLP